MTTRKIRKATPAAIVAPAIVGFTAEQAAALRTGMAAAIDAGRKAVASDTAKGGATDKLIAGLANPALLAHRFEFQARDRKGNVIETKHGSLYEYARKAAPFYTKGKQERARLTGFIAAVLAYAGVNDAASPAATKAWSIIKGQALPAAIALADNLIAAKVVDNILPLPAAMALPLPAACLRLAKNPPLPLSAR
jgi:hypothetical protein